MREKNLLRRMEPMYQAQFLASIPNEWSSAFSRSSTAWGFNAAGNLVSFASNTPVIDYNPSTLAPRGLAVFQSSTNYLLQSRTLTGTAWTLTGCTGTANVMGIDGTSNSAVTITAGTANASFSQAITLGSNTMSFSAYVKRTTGSGAVNLSFNGGTTVTNVASSINATAWTRVFIVGTATNPTCTIQLATSGDAIAIDQLQLEATAMPTNPMVTTTGTFTRQADVVINTHVPWLSNNAGSMTVEFERSATTGISGAGMVMELDDNSFNNRVFIIANNTDVRGKMFSNANNTPDLGFYPLGTAANQIVKAGLSYAGNNIEVACSTGNYEVTDHSTAAPLALTQMGIGHVPMGGTYINGWIRKIKYWNKYLGQTALDNLVRTTA